MTSNDSIIREEMDKVIADLENQNVSLETNEQTGLGDLVENVLVKFGITEEKFKLWFNLQECGCSKRKKYLNKLLSWKKKPENQDQTQNAIAAKH